MSQIKSKKRVADHGEVFTPPEFANRMLDALAEAWAASHPRRARDLRRAAEPGRLRW